MAELARLSEALAQLVAALEQLDLPHMVIGGVANLVWGEPRSTQDIDVTVSIPDERIDEVVAALGRRFSLLPSDATAFFRQTRVLPVTTTDGVRIDVVRAGLPYEEEAIRRARQQDLGGVEARIATAEDLIILKLASVRPRDREDVAGVLRRQRGQLDHAYLDPLVESLAEVLERPEIQDWYRRELERET